jgi:hypothetical protein
VAVVCLFDRDSGGDGSGGAVMGVEMAVRRGDGE